MTVIFQYGYAHFQFERHCERRRQKTGKTVVLRHKKENARMHNTCDKEEGTKDKNI